MERGNAPKPGQESAGFLGVNMEQTYIEIMIQSLNKKLQVLDQIIELNICQKKILEDSKASAEEFDDTVEKKSALIQQLQQLDSGFDKLYDRVKEELKGNKELYATSIRTMQDAIRKITDKSMEIQAQEARNKELMTRKFVFIKETSKNIRTNNKAVNEYYQNMMGLNYVEPQFMDNKK